MGANGLLVGGDRVLIPGLTIVGVGDAGWCKLDPADCRDRSGEWVRQVIIHTTKGDWPQEITPGKGPGGKAENTANYWRLSDEGRKQRSASHLVIDDDGTVACLTDLATITAFHATTSNAWSIGIEMYQGAKGVVYEATLDAAVKLTRFLCQLFGFAYQIPSRAYNNDAMDRMKFNGGPDMVGVFGHRDNAWDFVRNTSSRGEGDPGNEIYRRLAADGAEPMDFIKRKDIEIWTQRQTYLNAHGAHLKIDGIAGPNTMAAMRAQGFERGRDIPTP
jgi:N-acetylmuramoyl-L-alanine amidase